LNADTATAGRSSEKKLILVLFGSPHKSGFTARLLNDFLAPLESAAEIRIISAYESTVAPCIDCGACSRGETCSQRDFDFLDSLFRRADVIVVATPVYSLSFPAPLKAIVDRTQRYFAARFSLGVKPPIQKHKKAVLLVTGGSKNTQGAEIMARQLRMIFSVMNTTLDNEVVWTDTDADGGRDTYEAARERALKLALAIKCEL
jgi:Multimeric flavodoxin WrbA